MRVQIVDPVKGLIEPSPGEIMARLSDNNAPAYTEPFTRDLMRLAAGSNFKNEEVVRQELYNYIDKLAISGERPDIIKPHDIDSKGKQRYSVNTPAVGYNGSVGYSTYTDNLGACKRIYANAWINSFFSSFSDSGKEHKPPSPEEWEDIPGISPLDKATSVMRALASTSKTDEVDSDELNSEYEESELEYDESDGEGSEYEESEEDVENAPEMNTSESSSDNSEKSKTKPEKETLRGTTSASDDAYRASESDCGVSKTEEDQYVQSTINQDIAGGRPVMDTRLTEVGVNEDEDGEVTNRSGASKMLDTARRFFRMQRKVAADPSVYGILDKVNRKVGKTKDFNVSMLDLSSMALKLHESGFKGSTAPEYEEEIKGDVMLSRKIKDGAELVNMTTDSLVLLNNARSYFNLQLAEGELLVDVPHTRTAKQDIIMLIDVSGSMSSGNKRQIALAVLLNRLKAVIEGDAKIYFAFFEAHAYLPLKIASDKESAENIFLDAYKTVFDQGNTNVQRSILEAVKAWKELPDNKGRDPELIVVNDGQDTVYYEELTRIVKENNLVLHSLQLYEENKTLARVATESGGRAYTQFKGTDRDIERFNSDK